MLCLHTDGVDITRGTVAGQIEDATGSELLTKLYEKGMSTADIVAQNLATGGASSFGSLGKGLIAVAQALGDDFVRAFIKTYGEDAVRALLMRDIKTIASRNIKPPFYILGHPAQALLLRYRVLPEKSSSVNNKYKGNHSCVLMTTIFNDKKE